MLVSVAGITRHYNMLIYWAPWTHRQNIPSGLTAQLLNDNRCSPEKVINVALFANGGYFLSTMNGMWGQFYLLFVYKDKLWCFIAEATNNIPAVIQACITANSGGNKNILWIHHDSSDTSWYLICAISTRGDPKIFHAKLPTSLLSTMATEMFNPATFVVMGSLRQLGAWHFQPIVLFTR